MVQKGLAIAAGVIVGSDLLNRWLAKKAERPDANWEISSFSLLLTSGEAG
jgi:hypothetical protein